MSVRISSGLISITAVGGGDGAALGAVAANPTVWAQGATGKKAIPRKIGWRNRIAVNANLLIGYGDRTGAGSVFRQVYPSILMVTGVDGVLAEEELAVMGNGPEGFVVDTTAVTGSLGNIIVETDGAAGAAPLDVQVVMELEII